MDFIKFMIGGFYHFCAIYFFVDIFSQIHKKIKERKNKKCRG